MLFEDFDKKIKEAAEQHHPAYDEKAWQKMEKLLDENLPQPKNDRRRIIFFVLLFLLIGGGIYMTISHPWTKNSQPAELAKENKVEVQPGNKEQPVDKNLRHSGTGKVDNVNRDDIDNGNTKNVIQQTKQLNTSSTSNKFSVIKTDRNVKVNDQLADNSKNNLFMRDGSNQDKNSIADKTQKENRQVAAGDDTKTLDQTNLIPVAPTTSSKTDQNIALNEQKPKNDQPATTTDAKKSTTQKTLNKRNGFGFFVSAGPDVSKAADSKMGKTTLVYGAGVSYTKDHITLRTGIFASKKIYWAGPNDYKLSFTPPTPTKFEGADANCDVVEIP
ncbi:MAG TPA: hypothetical protein VGG71_05710, partial [Chitinophagaceae bacterium]